MEAEEPDNAEASCGKNQDKPASDSLRPRRKNEDQDNSSTDRNAKRPALQMTPAAALPQLALLALHEGSTLPSTTTTTSTAFEPVTPPLESGLSSLTDDALLLIFNKLSIGDKVRHAAVCRSWRALLRSKACWAGVPLRLTLSEDTWDDEASTLKKTTSAIVDALQCQLACGLRHATQLDIGFLCREFYSSPISVFGIPRKASMQLTAIAQCFLDRLRTAAQPALSIEALTLDGIFIKRELCDALAPHCQHTKTLHLTFPPMSSTSHHLPSLQHLLTACPSLAEIHFGCISFPLDRVDPALLAPLLPWFGSIHFNVRSRLRDSSPLTVPVPGIRCNLTLRGPPSASVRAVAQHLQQCQAAYHTIESPCRTLESVPAAPSLRELHLHCDASTDRVDFTAPSPHILSFSQDSILLENLRTLSVACPNLSCLSVSIVEPNVSSAATAASVPFPSFPSLIRLTVSAANIALVNHLVSTSPNLRELGLCRSPDAGTFEAILALPFLVSMRINLGITIIGHKAADDDWLHHARADANASTSSSAASSAPPVPASLPRLKHLHFNKFADLSTDLRPLCVLLGNSCTSLESLCFGTDLPSLMQPIVAVLLAGRFTRLRLAKTSFEPDAIMKLKARHPLCIWTPVVSNTSVDFVTL